MLRSQMFEIGGGRLEHSLFVPGQREVEKDLFVIWGSLEGFIVLSSRIAVVADAGQRYP